MLGLVQAYTRLSPMCQQIFLSTRLRILAWCQQPKMACSLSAPPAGSDHWAKGRCSSSNLACLIQPSTFGAGSTRSSPVQVGSLPGHLKLEPDPLALTPILLLLPITFGPRNHCWIAISQGPRCHHQHHPPPPLLRLRPHSPIEVPSEIFRHPCLLDTSLPSHRIACTRSKLS